MGETERESISVSLMPFMATQGVRTLSQSKIKTKTYLNITVIF